MGTEIAKQDSGQIAVPGYKITPTGLVSVGKPTQAQWEEVGNVIETVSRASQWIIGDWYLYGNERKWGELYADCEERFGIKNATAKNAAYVAREYQLSFRNDILTFQHHFAAVGVAEPDRTALLNQAVKEGWTVKQLTAEIKTSKPPKKQRKPVMNKTETDDRAKRDAAKILTSFDEMLTKVADGKTYTVQELDKQAGGTHLGAHFVRMCEVAPNVKIARSYGHKGSKLYTFTRNGTPRKAAEDTEKAIEDAKLEQARLNAAPGSATPSKVLSDMLEHTWTEWHGFNHSVGVSQKTLPRAPDKVKNMRTLCRTIRSVVNQVLDDIDREINQCSLKTREPKT